jgi:hypothetical protein
LQSLGIKISCKGKRDLYLLYRNTNDEALKNHYRLYCKILKEVLREAKRQYYNRQILNSNNKIRTVWGITKSVIGKLTNVETIQEIKANEEVIGNRQNIADLLNNFLSVVHNNPLANSKPSNYLQQAFNHPFPNIKCHAVMTFDLAEITKSLKMKGSHDYDEIMAKILKLSSQFITSPLTHMSNRMLSMGIFLDRLKFAEIKPFHKNGCKNDPLDYRPISLLPSHPLHCTPKLNTQPSIWLPSTALYHRSNTSHCAQNK